MEIKFQTTKTGSKRAYYFSRAQFRWFPLPVTEAESKLASGEATLVEAPKAPEAPKVTIRQKPVLCDERGRLVDDFAYFQNGGNC